jgi:hypothetical protein
LLYDGRPGRVAGALRLAEAPERWLVGHGGRQKTATAVRLKTDRFDESANSNDLDPVDDGPS